MKQTCEIVKPVCVKDLFYHDENLPHLWRDLGTGQTEDQA